MKRRAANLEPALTAGFLAANGELYCSRACAERAGQATANAVDLYEDGVLERADARAHLVCPACGGEYPQPTAEEDDRR